MSFNLSSNARELSFDYRASLVKCKYSGVYSLSNSQTEATFYGKYLTFSPTCQGDALTTLENWFQEEKGLIATFDMFDEIKSGRLISGNYSWTAEIGQNRDLLLKSWKLVNSLWVRQPYVVTSARPVSSNLQVINNRFTGTIGTVVDQVKFGFQIVPELDNFSYTRNGGKVTFDEIPFLVVPKSGWT